MVMILSCLKVIGTWVVDRQWPGCDDGCDGGFEAGVFGSMAWSVLVDSPGTDKAVATG